MSSRASTAAKETAFRNQPARPLLPRPARLSRLYEATWGRARMPPLPSHGFSSGCIVCVPKPVSSPVSVLF